MSMRRACVVALCTLLVACGGGSGGGATSNAAAGRTFTYGTPETFTTLSTTGAQLTALGALGQGASSASVQGLADANLADVILPPLSVAGAPADQVALRRALAAARPALATSYDPSCVTTTATSVTFAHCTSTDSGATVTLDGSFTVTDQQRLTWTLTAVISSSSSSGSLKVSATQTGDVTATPTAILGTELTTLTVDATANGQGAHASVDESLALDVTLDAACQTGAVAGTAEAKRVWTARPSGATSTDLADAAARVTWTGCGTATIQYSR